MPGKRGTLDLHTPDFWPAVTLESWRTAPLDAMQSWLRASPADHWKSRAFRPSAQTTYFYMFKTWHDHLAGQMTHILEATEADAEQFLLEKADLEPVSRLRYLQLLDRVYLHLAQECHWPGVSPFRRALSKESAHLVPPREVLTGAEQATLIEVLSEIPGFRGERDRAMAALFLGAGLRVNELIALPWSIASGISEAGYRLTLVPSGIHREHTTCLIPDGPWRAWWAHWEASYAPEEPHAVAIPGTQAGRPYTPSGVFRRVSSWLALAGLAEEEGQQGPNLLRNTFAWFALDRYSPDQVMEFLGHNERRHVEALRGNRPASTLTL